MAPSATSPGVVSKPNMAKDVKDGANGTEAPRCLIDRSLIEVPFEVIGSKGNYLHMSSGSKIFDATGGAAVACLGHGNREVKEAMLDQMDVNSYCNSMLFTNSINGTLAQEIIRGTGNLMSRVYICSSGSEATEAAMKMGRQYFYELSPRQPQRTKFIAREHSYHGNTIGSLSLSGHVARREAYTPILSENISWVSACNPYRQRLSNESDAAFVARKAAELDNEFQRLGPDTVIGFVCEPISGAALGCVPYVDGYLSAMKGVCRKYGALFMLDEIMSGMGRSGTLHAWQGEHVDGDPKRDCLPDLQMVGKGLGGGYQPIAAVIAGKQYINAIKAGSGGIIHGQTYQAHPVACAASLAVQRIIRRENLLSNVMRQGAYLSQLLRQKLGSHPHVGDIRGKGLFWGVEFVRDKETKEPFPKTWGVAGRMLDVALKEPFNITFYPGQGTADGWEGDHVIVSPAYNVTKEDVELITDKLVGVLDAVFEQMKREGKGAGDN
ncbi:hypothetical protein V499_08677 [Pseudogymnoascus sp. VKM F-103]|nr:hypothetical protein V499_08677 [Pseudogymnoascus sp. VKM F-103]